MKYIHSIMIVNHTDKLRTSATLTRGDIMTNQKHWLVSSYIVFEYGEALQLAQVVANRTGLRIAIMEKLDSFTPYYIAREVYPNIYQ